MAQDFHIQEVMNSLGWKDNSYIPMANDDNKKIMENINELLKERTEKSSALQGSSERLDKIKEHYKNAEQNIDQNMKLVNAHKSQLTDENHMFKLTHREDMKLKQMLKEFEKEAEDRNSYEEKTEKEIKRVAKHIDQMSEKIDWAKLALVEWRQAASKGDEINKMIHNYCKKDEEKATCLESRRRILQDTINKQKKVLIDLYQEQKSIEQSLDRTAELYRQAHRERRQMVDTWKDAVSQMNQREQNIGEVEDLYDLMRHKCKEKAAELKEHDDFLVQLKITNKEVEIKIKEHNDEISILKSRLKDITDLVLLKANEIKMHSKVLQGLTQKVQQQRGRNRLIAVDKDKKELQIENVEEIYDDLEKRYKEIINKTISAKERIERMDELITFEDKTKDQVTQELVRLNEIFYRSQQQLNKMKDEEKIFSMENKGILISLDNIKKSLEQLEKQLQQEIELEYNMGFKVQILEMKIANMEGKDEFDGDKKARHMQLEGEVEAALKEINVLQSQIKKVEEDMKKLTCNYYQDITEIENMKNKIKQAELLCEGGEKQLKAVKQQNQERIVELSILKMRNHEMEKQIEKHDNKAYSLEKHRIHLEKTIKERLLNIKIQMDLLFLKRKHLQEENSTLRADLGDRDVKIDALKKRYELSIELLGKNDDGSVVTTTQLKIEAAQERQLLLQDGNELNEKVLKAEHDIKAMENTLCLINFSNNAYRKQFENLDDDNPDIIELKTLQKNYCSALQKLKELKSNINLRLQNIEEGYERRQVLERELEEKIRSRLDHKEILMKVYKELMDQKNKLQRAERELKLAHKSLRKKCIGPEYLCVFEKDLAYREQEEKNTTALQLIADLIDTNLEITTEVSKLLCEKGLEIPQIRRSKSQSSWLSVRSEMSSEIDLRKLPGLDRDSFSSASSSSSSKISSPSASLCASSLRCKMTGSACPSIVSIDFPVVADDKAGQSAKSTLSKQKK